MTRNLTQKCFFPFLGNLKCLALLLGLFLFTAPTFASHIAGVEINYECVGGSNYEITVRMLRDCSGILAQPSTNVTLTSSCGATFTAPLPQISSTEVSDVCISQLPNTTCNAGILPGMQLYIYKATVNLSGCADWNVSWQLCCRNTSVNSTGGNMYTESEIHILPGVCNTSPMFPMNRPIPYLSIGSTQNVLSYVAFDPDGDNLQYSLVSAKVSSTANVVYNFPFGPLIPMGTNGLSINPSTGLITINSAGLPIGNYIVVVKVEEFDSNGNLKGFVTRDAQFVMISGTNQAPVSNGQLSNVTGSGVALGSSGISVTNGGSFCFDVTFTDPDPGTVMSATSNLSNYFPGATVSVSGSNPMTVTVCGTANLNYGNSIPVTVTANDNVCPIAATHSVYFNLQVAATTWAGPDQVICDGDTAFLAASGDSAFTWSVISGDPIVTGTNFGCTSCASTWALPAITTTYQLVGLPSGLMDTITVTPLSGPNLVVSNDTSVCAGTCITIGASGGGSYLWSTGDTLDSLQVCLPGTYSVTVTDSNGCTATDSVVVNHFPTTTVSVSNDTSICDGDSVLLSASGNGSFIWSTGATTSNIVATAAGTYSVTYTDTNGCSVVDSIQVLVNPNPIVNGGQDTVLCIGDTITLTATGAVSYVWSNGTTGASTTIATPGLVLVTGTDAQGCSSTDSIYLFPNSSRYVGGYVTDSNGNALTNTWVYLIKYYNAQDSVVALDSVLTDSNGFYLFGTTETVVYVKSGPDSSAYPMQIPTYHGSAPVFVQADSIITVPCDTAWADIDNLSGMNPGGPAFVAGYVFQGAGKSSVCEGDPVVGLSLILLNDNGELVAQVFTDADGNYRFENLTPGTYTIWADDPKVDLMQAPTFTLAAGDNGLTSNLQYKNNTLEFCGGVGINQIASGLESLHFFPNPSTGEVTLELDLQQSGVVQVNILDALGATVWQRQLSGNGKQVRETLDLSGLSTGVYFLQVTTGEQGTTKKLILR